MNCPKCGDEKNGKNNFCINCGQKLKSVQLSNEKRV